MVEIKITVKGEDSTLVKKYLEYDHVITMNKDDPFLSQEIAKLIEEFGQPADAVIINVKMVW